LKDNEALLSEIIEKFSKLDKLDELEGINTSLRDIRNKLDSLETSMIRGLLRKAE